MVGFANNFDFLRQSSCVGLWEDYGDRPKTHGHPDGPVPRLVFDGDRQKYLCMASIDNLFPYLAAHMHHKHDHVDLREVGAWKALFAAAAFLLALARPMPAYARLFMAAAAGLALGDLDTLSYANTLYLEFSVVVAGIVALAACSQLAGSTAPPRWRDVCVAAGAVAWLGLAKQQYGGLAIAIAVVSGWIVFATWRHRFQACVLIAAGVGAAGTFDALNATPWGLVGAADAANHTDTFLGAVLPAAADRSRALHTLGLPPSCAAGIGQTWYSPGLQANHPCPGILHVSRWRLLPLFGSQPATFTIPMAHTIALTQRPAPDEPDRWERRADALRPRFLILRLTSPTYLFALLPPILYRLLVATTCIGGGMATAMLATRAGKSARPGAGYGLPMIAFGGLATFYAVVSTAFGDGYQDARRHAVLLPCALVVALAGTSCWIHERTRRDTVSRANRLQQLDLADNDLEA